MGNRRYFYSFTIATIYIYFIYIREFINFNINKGYKTEGGPNQVVKPILFLLKPRKALLRLKKEDYPKKFKLFSGPQVSQGY